MASRFWTGAVGGGTGTWDASNTANWSTTTGGAGGASAPTAADTAFIDANSGSGVISITGSPSCLRFVITGYTGTLNFGSKVSVAGNAATIVAGATTCTVTGTPLLELTYAGATGTRTCAMGTMTAANAISVHVVAGTDIVSLTGNSKNVDFTGFSGSLAVNVNRTIFGGLVLSPTMTWPASTGTTTFGATSTGHVITTNGVTIDQAVNFNGVGGGWTFLDDWNQGATRLCTLTSGTLDTNGKVVDVGIFSSNVATARTLAMGASVFKCRMSGTAFTAASTTNLTVTFDDGAAIELYSASAKTFIGGGFLWPKIVQAGLGALTITGNNTFADGDNTVQPATVLFAAGSVQTFGDFNFSGITDSPITIGSVTAGQQFTLSKASGLVSVSNTIISDSIATGGATWRAIFGLGNVDAGNNEGWMFEAEYPNDQGNPLGAIPVLIALSPTVQAAQYPNDQGAANAAIPVHLYPQGYVPPPDPPGLLIAPDSFLLLSPTTYLATGS